MATQTTKRGNFLSNLSVARRIYALILIPLAILFITGIFAIIALNQNRLALEDMNNRVVAIDQGNKIIRRMQRDYIILLHEVQIGSRTAVFHQPTKMPKRPIRIRKPLPPLKKWTTYQKRLIKPSHC